MRLLTKKQQESKKLAIFAKKSLKINFSKIKNIVNLEIIVIMLGHIEVLRIACVIYNEQFRQILDFSSLQY